MSEATMNMEVVKKSFKTLKACQDEIDTLKQEISLFEDEKKDLFSVLLEELKINPKSEEGKMAVSQLKKALEMYLAESKKKQLHVMMGAKQVLECVEGVDYDE